jgi:hypothetical protein
VGTAKVKKASVKSSVKAKWKQSENKLQGVLGGLD